MKRRVLSLITVLALCLALLPTAAFAAEVAGGSCGGNLTWTLDDAGVLTISGTGAMTDWGFDATPWNSRKATITSVVIGDGVTTIGDCAFYSCTNLAAVTIPEGVTSIGRSAFVNCSGLATVTLPDSLTTIYNYAFNRCSSLTSITIPKGVTSVIQVFDNCDNLARIDVAADNQYLRSDDGVVFEKNMPRLLLCPAGRTGQYNIPAGTTTISDSAFRGCNGLTGITIPDSVTQILGRAFSGCSGLTSITIPKGLTSANLSDDAFGGCGFTSIHVAEGNPDYSSVGGVLFNKDGTKLIKYPQKREGAYTIPDGVTSIDAAAFSGCAGLTSITIPDSVTSIGKHAFNDCDGLTSVTIPGSVTSISGYAFSSCDGLESVEMHKGVTTIGEYAFSLSKKLKRVTIPGSVTSISTGVFSTCESLSNVTIGDGVKSIGKDAFYHCLALTGVTIPTSVTTIGSGAFSSCAGLTSVTVPDSVTSIGDEAFMNCSKLADVTINANVDSIANGMFQYCKVLTSIAISDSVKSIGDNAFRGCEGLTNIDIPGSVTSIGGNAFYESGLTSITVPDSVTSIGTYAFYACADLQSVTLSANITEIGERTFQKCGNLTAIEIPGKVTTIGKEAFRECKKLVSITIPASVTKICDSAFLVCDGLETVVFEGDPSDVTIEAGNEVLLKFDAPANSNGVYQLKNANDLFWFAQQVNTGATNINAELVNDIDLHDGTVNIKMWSPIGIDANPYAGTFDGHGHSIKNMTIDNSKRFQGFFGYVRGGARIKNVIIDSSCSVSAYDCSAGLVAVGVSESSTQNIEITGCGNHAAVTVSDHCAGGILGTFSTSNGLLVEITDCYNTGTITTGTTGAAGIFGSIGVFQELSDQAGRVTNCWSSGTLFGTTQDPLGHGKLVTVENCYTLDTLGDSKWTSGCEKKSASQFASGEVAYLLQKGQDAQAWGQQLTGDAADALPVLTGDSAKRVYKVTFQANGGEHAAAYTNPNGTVTLPDAPEAAPGFAFYRWSQTNAADGAEFKADTPVTADMTVFAVRQEQYGENGDTHTVTTTYGQAAELDLAECVYYGGGVGSEPRGLFDYTINSGNDALGASVSGDTLSVPNTANAGSYTLSVTATEKEPQISLFSLDPAAPALGTQPVTFTVTVTVNKATPSVTALIPAHLTYTGEAQDLVTSCTTTGGTLQYSTNGAAYSEKIPQGTDAGKYTVYYKVVGDENYEDMEARQSDVTIDPKALAGTVTIDGTAAMNEILSAVLSDSAQTASYQWHRNGATIDGAADSSYTLTAADVGTTITVKATGTGNYTGDLTSEATSPVTEALPKITTLPTAGAITYGQALSDSSLTGGEASVDGAFAWTTDSTKPTVADSGKTYSVTFTPSVDGYAPVTGEVTVTVTPAPLTITAATLAAKTYDATTAATVTGVTFDGLVNGETLALDTDYTATAAFNSADVKDATTATVTVTLTNANYALAVNTFDVAAAIAPKTLDPAALTVKVEPVHYEYTGAAITPTQVTVLDGGTVIPDTEYTLAYENNTHVGQATVTVTDKEDGNYTFTGAASGSFEITKPSLAADDVTVTLGETEYTYDGTAKAPTVTVVKGGVTVNADEYDVSYSNTNGGADDHTGAGTVTVTVTAKDGGDYFGSNSATFVIKPKDVAGAVVTLAADPTYDGAEQTMTVEAVTVDGLDVTYDIASGNKGADAGAYTLILTANGNFTGTAEAVWNILPASLADAVLTNVEALSFTGADLTPEPTVTWNGKTLEAGTDFTYTYENNHYVGTATVNVSGTGNYTGPATAGADFAIEPVNDPAVIVPSATVTRGGNTVDLSGNVTGAIGAVSYACADGSGDVSAQGVFTSPRNSGSATVTVTVAATDLNGDGVDEYTGKTAEITVTISEKTVEALDVAQAGGTFGEALAEPVYDEPQGVIATTTTYTGKTRSGADYAGADAPTEAGTYTVKVVCETATRIYEGASQPFTVEPKRIDGAEITLGGALTYNGQSQTQSVDAVTLEGEDILAACDVTGNTATGAGDHTLTVTAKAAGNYTGSVTKTFTMERKAITPAVEGVVAKDYTGAQLTQSGVTVKDGETALAATDYEIVYGENITAGADAGSLTVKAKAEGNYTFADATVTFDINKTAYSGETATTAEARFGDPKTVDLTALLAEGYELGEVTVASDADNVLNGAPTLDGATLTFAFVDDAAKAGKTATIQVAVTNTTNYLPYNLTVTVTVTDKLVQENFKFAESAKSVVYGGTLDYPATGAVAGSTVSYASSDPTVATVDKSGKVTALKAGTATVTATASAAGDYAQATASYILEVTRATVTVTAMDRNIYVGETVPDLSDPKQDADYTVAGLVGEDALVGTVELKYQQDGADVTPGKAGTYDIVISGVAEPAGGNYSAIVLAPGKLTVTARPSGGHSGGNSGTVGTRPETQTHEDGSVTTTVTDKNTGAKTETTKHPDGAQTVVTTQKDGAQSVAATVPAQAVEAAGEKGQAVQIQAPALTPAESAGKATPVTVDLSGKPSAKVELPVENVTPGTVAVLVKPDGTEEIVRDSIPTGTGIAFTVRDGQTVKIVNNAKRFEDVADNAWYADSVAFVSGHELFNGTSATAFSPDMAMDRGMLVAVLYRLENEPGTTGAEMFRDVADGQYYTHAVTWAAERNIVNGYSDGSFGPGDPITREQLAVLLWRYAGSPAVSGSLDGFTDAAKAGAWAVDALRWAVEQGILNGKGGGILDPQGRATRAEVAAMLTRFIRLDK